MREVALERMAVEGQSRRAVLRPAQGMVEVVRERDTLLPSIRARRERELASSMARTDTVKLRADYVEVAPVAGGVRMAEVPAERALQVRMRDSTGGRIILRENAEPGRARARMPNGLEKIDPDHIESIEVIKGGVFEGLAPAVSGVIVIRLKH